MVESREDQPQIPNFEDEAVGVPPDSRESGAVEMEVGGHQPSPLKFLATSS